MLSNITAAAWRSACRDRVFAILNISGLALGFAAFFLIWLFVRDELSYNNFLPNMHDVYRVQLTIAETGQSPVTFTGTPAPMAAELQLDFPEVIATARTRKVIAGLRHGGIEGVEEVQWADADFFKVLGYPLLRGDAATALSLPDSIVLTRAIALKYFGTIDCLGQMLDIDHRHLVRVTAIAEDVPSNATKSFTVLASGNTAWGMLAAEDAQKPAPGVLSLGGDLYVRLKAGTHPEHLAARFRSFAHIHYPDPDSPEPLFAAMHLHSLADLHLHPYNSDTGEPDNFVQTLTIVAATGLVILLLAACNFVNMSTARATRRAVEVGVRKSLGAQRSQLIAQFMGESVATSLVGLVFGVGIAELCLPTMNAFLDRQIGLDLWHHPALAAMPVATAFLLGLAGGVYPALVLSAFPPAYVLKGQAATATGGSRLRLGLVAFQFTATITLLIATAVIHAQFSFATTRALGFDKNQIVTVDLTGMPETPTADGLGHREAAPLEALRTRLATIPGVRSMAATFTLPLWSNFLRTDFVRPGQSAGQAVNFTMQPVDFGYFSTFGIHLTAGRDFSRDRAEDTAPPAGSSASSAAIINETAMHALGFSNPAAAIGQEISSTDTPPAHHRIIGVVPDFPLDSIRSAVPPSLFVVDPGLFKVLSIKLFGADLPATLHGIDSVWHEFVPGQPVHRMFLDQRIAGLYLDVTRQARLFATFAGFAVVIGCLGLVGLSAYTAERRTREIGIRKALGASAFDICSLLIRQMIAPVLLANVIAWPIAWWFMSQWLNGFAYRIDLTPMPFVVAALFAVLIAVTVTFYHAVKVAMARPIEALRYV